MLGFGLGRLVRGGCGSSGRADRGLLSAGSGGSSFGSGHGGGTASGDFGSEFLAVLVWERTLTFEVTAISSLRAY